VVLGWKENTVGRGDRDACWWHDGVVLDWEKAVGQASEAKPAAMQ
jgi:hypothetical protein